MEIFKNKKPNFEKLKKYGFATQNKTYTYQTNIMNGDFNLTVEISQKGEIHTKLIETAINELYTLHLVKDADGTFVGQIKEEYTNILKDICKNCFDDSIFKSPYTHKVMKYIETTYKDKAEYLWEKFPENAIYRRKETQKWYAVILTVKKNKFGFDSEETVEVLDLHAKVDDVPRLTKEPNIYPGYHMNKKHWITVILDGSFDLESTFKLIDKSYELAKK